ncbi:hypothetical protein RFI_24117, partial [Reticulomyxa filosa]
MDEKKEITTKDNGNTKAGDFNVNTEIPKLLQRKSVPMHGLPSPVPKQKNVVKEATVRAHLEALVALEPIAPDKKDHKTFLHQGHSVDGDTKSKSKAQALLSTSASSLRQRHKQAAPLIHVNESRSATSTLQKKGFFFFL